MEAETMTEEIVLNVERACNMLDKDKATARPWKYEQECITSGTDLIADMLPPSIEANAQLIVKAVNSYEAMKEALEGILQSIYLDNDSGDYFPDASFNSMLGEVRNALKLAEGGENV